MDLIITILPVVTKDLPISPRFTPYNFLSRCRFSTLTTTRQPIMVEFYFLTFPRFPLRKKEHKSYFGKNRTHDFRTRRCAAYLLDHSGDEQAESGASLSGLAIAYRWRSLPRVRRHGASKPQGSSERVLPSQVIMDQLMFASLSHTHYYWYEVVI